MSRLCLVSCCNFSSSHNHSFSSARQVLPRTEALDVIQSQLKCCGGKGPRDWAKSYFNNGDANKSGVELGVSGITGAVAGAVGIFKVPESCCTTDPEEAACQASLQVPLSGTVTGVISQEVGTMWADGESMRITEICIDRYKNQVSLSYDDFEIRMSNYPCLFGRRHNFSASVSIV